VCPAELSVRLRRNQGPDTFTANAMQPVEGEKSYNMESERRRTHFRCPKAKILGRIVAIPLSNFRLRLLGISS
jgi:hypothetical protein